jgi:uncharacterized BrkB/YihY/UPF0761 family membrane protein
MIWLWISAVVVLLGAKLNAEVEHQTARDSTIIVQEATGTPHRGIMLVVRQRTRHQHSARPKVGTEAAERSTIVE